MLNIKDILNNLILEKWTPKNKKKHSACKAKVKARVKDWPSAYASGQVVQCYYNEGTEMKFLRKLFERSMTASEMKEEKKLHKTIPKEPFEKQYGSRGEEVYYATTKKMAMENTDCGCERRQMMLEAVKRSKKRRRGSPWFRHVTTGALIKRGDEGRLYMSSDQVQKRHEEGMKRIGSLKNPKAASRYGPAKTREEVFWAAMTNRATGMPSRGTIGRARPGAGVSKRTSGKKPVKKKAKSIRKKTPRKKTPSKKPTIHSSIRQAVSRLDQQRSAIRSARSK